MNDLFENTAEVISEVADGAGDVTGRAVELLADSAVAALVTPSGRRSRGALVILTLVIAGAGLAFWRRRRHEAASDRATDRPVRRAA